MTAQQKILIADADGSAAEFSSACLTRALFQTRIVPDIRKLHVECANFCPDLILMESRFPDTEPFQVYQELRGYSGAPVIFLSDANDVQEKVQGLELGADDYLSKPCDARELLARVRAVLRRTAGSKSLPSDGIREGEYVEYPDLLINRTAYSVLYQGEVLNLPPRELELLYFLASSPNQVFSREQLLDSLWGYDYMGDTRTVDVHIKRLREKFRDHTAWAIKTVWGVGYKFEIRQ